MIIIKANSLKMCENGAGTGELLLDGDDVND